MEKAALEHIEYNTGGVVGELLEENGTNNFNYVQDDQGQWWYINGGRKYRAIERVCSSCSKVEVVRSTTKTDVCKSCALTGIPKSEFHKLKISVSNEGKGLGVYNDRGYIRILKKDHPGADSYGYILEHRLVVENLIGRYLRPEEVVHHIDENKSNNHPNNLWLFDNKSDHMRFHNRVRKNLKKSNYIYLAGNISQDPDTYRWREDVERLVKKERLYHKVVIVNPCANGFNRGMREVGSHGLEFIKEAKKRSQYLLRSKDYQLIRMCNLMVVDLVIGASEKPLIGTIQELCWAKDIFKIPVIAITHGKNTPYTTHMWIDECCSARVNSVEEAAEMIKTFFLEY